MRIIKDEVSATLTFVPVEQDEEQTLISIAQILKPGAKMSYGGRDRDCGSDKFSVVILHAKSTVKGAKKAKREEVELILRGSTEDDKYAVNGIRNTCFFGSGELIFISTIDVEGKKAIVVTAMHCKICGKPMIDSTSCECKTCKDCSAKCHHKYERGAVHGPSLEIGLGEFCSKCGRGKPKAEGELEKSQFERQLEVEQELGIVVLDKSSGLSASQIDFLQKMASVPFN